MFWDDQQGVYCYYIKRDGSYNTGDFPNYGRSYCFFKTHEVAKAWPFNPVPNPYYEGWAFPAVTGEGITILGPDLMNPNKEQVFRTRAKKYEWAPDTYVSFLERSHNPPQLTVSRDAVNWHIFDREEDGHYVPRIKGAGYIQNGLVRRGDELWQYVNIFGGNIIRLTQRLDGFVSLDADEQPGVIITRPFVFEGEKLTLNVDAGKGSVKVGILNLPGRQISAYGITLSDDQEAKTEVTGFRVGDCDLITADSVRHVVTWKGISDVGNLAGQVIRLRIEMQNAKLYAFKFD